MKKTIFSRYKRLAKKEQKLTGRCLISFVSDLTRVGQLMSRLLDFFLRH